jgi:hypothetical protein
MILRSRTVPAAVYIRVLIAWLLAMQPMLGGYYAAQAANIPLAMELCRGAPAPLGDLPAGNAQDHSACCLAACTPASAPPPASGDALAAPASFASSPPVPRPAPLTVAQAGLGPQSARAPPL